MGAPFHQIKKLCERNGVVVLSSNYELYGDMSRRVVSVLATFAPELEVYSIDESFLDLTGVNDPFQLSVRMRDRVKQWSQVSRYRSVWDPQDLSQSSESFGKEGGGGL